jgi:hypothetical protein
MTLNRRKTTQSGRREGAFVLLGYAILTLAMTYPLILEFGRAIPGDGFDGWQNYWNLWWVRVALVEQGANPIFTHILYHPTGVSLAFHTLNIFNGLFTLPIQLAADLFPAYNTVVYFSFVAGAFGAYLLARYALLKAGWHGRWTVWPAALAGVIYGFSPFHFAHLLGHMQVLSLQWLPFAALGLLRGLDQLDAGRPGVGRIVRAAAMPALFLILVGLCDWYYAFYISLFTAVLLVYRLIARRLRWPHLAAIGLAWLAFLVILAPMWLPMAREAGQADYMVPDESQALDLSADLLAFVTPSEFHPIWGEAASRFGSRLPTSRSERVLFAGYLPLLLGGLAACKLGRRSRFWWVATLAFVICALGPILHIGGKTEFFGGVTIPLPYMLLYRLAPVVRIARSIARFDVMVMLNLSVLAALGLAWIIKRFGQRPAAIGAIAIAIVCFEFWSAPYPFSPPDTPAFYEQLAGEEGEFAVLNLPMNWDRPGYLLYQTVHQKPLTVAYISRNDPRTLIYRAPVLQEFRHLGADILTDDPGALGSSVLSWLDVRYVILDRYKMPGGLEREFTTALTQDIFEGVAPVYEDERLTVYQVAAPECPLPFAILGDGWGPRRESNGEIWREITGRAELAVHAAAGQTLRVTIDASAPAGATLTLREAASGASTSVALTQTAGQSVLEWVTMTDNSVIEWIVEGEEPCTVWKVDVQTVEP